MRHTFLIGCLLLLDHGCARPECAPDERQVGSSCYELGARANGEHEPIVGSMDGGAVVITASDDAGAGAVDAAVDAGASACDGLVGTPCDNGLQGVCRRSGVWTCNAQQQPACDAPVDVKPGRCRINVRDGLDDDCDGVADEADLLPGPAVTFCYG